MKSCFDCKHFVPNKRLKDYSKSSNEYRFGKCDRKWRIFGFMAYASVARDAVFACGKRARGFESAAITRFETNPPKMYSWMEESA